jgi:hypothetical protein
MSVPADQMQAVDSAMAQGNAEANGDQYDAQTCADVKEWQKKIKEARDHDKPQRKRYALNRRYARGEGKWDVNVPIAGPNIDILTSLLYARNPDLDVQPAPMTTPPPMSQIMEMARKEIVADPATKQMMLQVGVQATQAATLANQQAIADAPQVGMGDSTAPKNLPAPPVPPEVAGEMAAQAWLQATIKKAAKEIMAPFRQRVSDAKQIGQTLEIVVSNMWQKARLKARMKTDTRSGLTVGVGYLKATWQERDGTDPVAADRQRDSQDKIAKLQADQNALDGGDVADQDAARAQVEQEIEGLESGKELDVNRGMAIDFVRAEDITIPTSVSDISMYLDSPWIGHRIFIPRDEALAVCPELTEEDIKAASTYWLRKLRDPKDKLDVGPIDVVDIDPEDADQFKTDKTNGSIDANATPHVCLHEIWSKATGMVLGIMEGVDDKYARKPAAVNVGTTRFYSFFQLAFVWEDGERHPVSLVERASSLLDEISRLYSDRRDHRRRTKPKTVFDKGNLSPDDASAITNGGSQEMIGLEPTVPGSGIANMVTVLQYAKVDEALYNDRDTMDKTERVFGVQEALASTLNGTPKTATEAEIQQTGTNARTNFKRDAMDEMLSDLAQYSAEIAVQKYSHDEIVQIAGPWAMWPQGLDVQHLDLLVNVSIKAGSSGKPDTAAQQQAWATLFPLLNQSILKIGQLRQSDPGDIADCLEELMEETVSRTGERLDVSRFSPPAPSQEPGPMPQMPGAPGSPAPGAGAAPMPAQAPPTDNPNNLPVPKHGHVMNAQNHIVKPGAMQ